MADVQLIQDKQVKNVKRLLEGWRMALIPLKSVILWEQQWHPGGIVGALTFFYLFIWLLDLNFLSTFAIIGLFINLVDFLVPITCSTIYGSNSWTGQKEKTFEEICISIVVFWNKALSYVNSYWSLRESSPCMYYVASISILSVIAWTASTINNIFLLYLLSTVMLLWPGIQQRGITNYLLSLVNMGTKTLKTN